MTPNENLLLWIVTAGMFFAGFAVYGYFQKKHPPRWLLWILVVFPDWASLWNFASISLFGERRRKWFTLVPPQQRLSLCHFSCLLLRARFSCIRTSVIIINILTDSVFLINLTFHDLRHTAHLPVLWEGTETLVGCRHYRTQRLCRGSWLFFSCWEKSKRKKSSMKIDAASLILGGGLLMFALLAAVYVEWTQRHYSKHR